MYFKVSYFISYEDIGVFFLCTSLFRNLTFLDFFFQNFKIQIFSTICMHSHVKIHVQKLKQGSYVWYIH